MKTFSIIIVSLFLIISFLPAQVPQLINYQGKLDSAGVPISGIRNLTFKIYDAGTAGSTLWTESQTNVPVTNGIFNVLLGSVTPFTVGVFGGTGERHLGVTVGTGTEMSPRYRITSTAFSIRAASADGVADNTITSAKIVNGTITTTDIAAGQVVTAVNSLKDSITLAAGTNITITPAGNTLTIAADGGGTVTSVGSGTPGANTGSSGLTFSANPITSTGTIAVANNGVTSAMILDGTVATSDLADNSVTSAKILDGTIATADLATNSVTAVKIPTGQVVKSLNTLTDSVTLAAGTNVTIIPSGNTLTISSTGGGSGTVTEVNTSGGLTGGPITTKGTISIASSGVTEAKIADGAVTGAKLSLPLLRNVSTSSDAFTVENSGSGTAIRGEQRASSGSRIGVLGISLSTSGIGVYGWGVASSGTNYGVYGEALGGTSGRGVYGIGSGYGVYGRTNSTSGYGVYGIYGGTTAADAVGVYGMSKPADYWGIGGSFLGGYTGAEGIGDGGATTGIVFGIYGVAIGTAGTRIGVYGTTTGAATTRRAGYFSGDLQYTGSLIGASDERLKHNIQPISGALTKLKKIEPHSFTYRNNAELETMNLPQGTQYGLIAQELEKIFPELVVESHHPTTTHSAKENKEKMLNYKGVKYVDLIPVLIQAVKEQQEMIENLRMEIKQLRDR